MRRLAALLFALLAAAPFVHATDRTGQGRLRIPLLNGVRTIGITNTTPIANKSICGLGAADGCTYPKSVVGVTGALTAALPDDIIELRTVTPGGSETWATRFVCNSTSGTAGHEITVRLRAGDHVLFSATTSNNPPPAPPDGMFDMNGCNYWIFAGDPANRAGLRFGDRALWAQACAIAYNCYPQKITLKVINSHHVRFSDMEISGASSYGANVVDRVSNFLYFSQMLFDRHGSVNAELNPKSDTGNLFDMLGHHAIFADVEFGHGGHENIGADGPWQIYRRVIGDGDWTGMGTGYNGTHAATFSTNRNYVVSIFPPLLAYGPLLVEDSIFKNADFPSDETVTSEGIKLQGLGVIFRSNYMWDNVSGAHIALCATVDTGNIKLTEAWTSIYNNTTYNGAGIAITNGYGYNANVDPKICEKFTVINNVFQGVTPAKPAGQPWAYIWNLGQYTTPDAGYPNALKGGYIAGNIFGAHPTTPTQNMQFRVTGAGNPNVTVSVTDCVHAEFVDASVPGGHNICNNQNVVLAFANGTSNPARSKSGMMLSPASPFGIGDALPITTTTDAGTTDTTLTLAWARPLKDDWGFGSYTWGGYSREYGDCICVGPAAVSTVNQCVVTRIADDGIDYTTGAIVVSPGVTHAAASKVWKATNNADGTCGPVWKNRGAILQ